MTNELADVVPLSLEFGWGGSPGFGPFCHISAIRATVNINVIGFLGKSAHIPLGRGVCQS
jgi:hypothetical protein